MADAEATVFIYTTFASETDAEALGSALLEKNLIACANIFPAMRSIYRWKGEVHKDPEVAAILKTRKGRVAEVMAEAKHLHPYEAPALVAFEVAGTDVDFAAWIAEQTGA